MMDIPGFDPMKAMMLQIFLGNLARDLRKGKVEETIESLDKCVERLQKQLDDNPASND